MRRLVTLAAVLALAALPAAAQHLRIYYPDIEQGSATLVVSPTGQALLIDAGSGLKAVEDRIEDFLNDLIDAGVVVSLDYILATHYDEDHIGRMENVFQLVPLPVTVIAYDRGEFGGVPATFAYADYAFAAGFHNRTTVPVCTVIDLGGGVIATVMTVNGEVCGAATVDVSGSEQFENAVSVSVVVSYGDVDVWIGGDLTGNPDFNLADVESAVAPEAGDLDVYTVNHHGSRTSSNATFLTALKAEIAINQNSASNSFGHPNTEVVERFLGTPDSAAATPRFYQQNPGDPDDDRSDDGLAAGIGDCDDIEGTIFADGFESGDLGAWGQPGLPAAACDVPGTMLLLSDATSYRLHACGIRPTAFAADFGIGTIGDYPPAIRRVRRSPEVPEAVEGVVVEAVVDGAVSAEIRYQLGGVVQAPIAMSGGGSLFTGTIPAQPDGTRVRFRVAATDALAQTELSAAQGYFSGLTPIATLRSNDADEVLIPKNFGARVEGTITAEPGIFHPTVTQAYVQDATGGVQIFDLELLEIARGDVVRFVGRLEQFGSQTEVNTAENCGNLGHTLIGAGIVPEPERLTVAEVGEAVEGRLIRIDGVTVVDGEIPGSGNGTLVITDDGGVSTLDLRVDGDTDIPGANTPTQPFDIVGIAGQFDTFVPLTSGYQILPRQRLDFLSAEVNHPVVLISEIHTDPAAGLDGDANGDGVRDGADDEFLEILNTGVEPFDVSGYTLADATSVRHVFPPGTVIPAREAAVVFGGGTPTGSFGNAAANSLVFTASTGTLALGDTSETVTFADDLGEPVQAVTYGAEGAQNQSLVRDPDHSNAPFVLHTSATGSGGSR
ncbi:MAG: lamin tail domain-containing protein, partial [Thermoanaerobaculia bacterium]